MSHELWRESDEDEREMDDRRDRPLERSESESDQNVHVPGRMMHGMLSPKQADFVGKTMFPVIQEVARQHGDDDRRDHHFQAIGQADRRDDRVQ